VQVFGWPYDFEWMHVDTALFNDGIPYPDPLGSPREKQVKAHCTVSVCLIFRTPAEAAAGTYGVKVRVLGEKCEQEAMLSVQVHDVVMPQPKDAALDHDYYAHPLSGFSFGENKLDPPCDPFYDFERYSPQWWNLVRELARSLTGMRGNNMWLQEGLLWDAGSRKTGPGQWTLDFTLTEKYVRCYLENGSFRYINAALGVVDVTGEYVVSVDEKSRPVRIPISDPEAEIWLSFYVKELYVWFEKMGLLHMLHFHIQDEPHASKDWLWARDICRKYAPGIPCGEPLDTYEVAVELEGACDFYIPRLEVYEQGEDFFRKRQAAGDQVWAYSCCFPEGEEYMNRFIDRPHIQGRLLYWACFSQNITGFLHWGFSFWDSKSIHCMTPEARFKGDGYVTYPDVENNSYLPSMRYMAALMGAEEYELLAIAAKKHPEAAKTLSVSMARNFRVFEKDSDRLDEARARLFALCEAE